MLCRREESLAAPTVEQEHEQTPRRRGGSCYSCSVNLPATELVPTPAHAGLVVERRGLGSFTFDPSPQGGFHADARAATLLGLSLSQAVVVPLAAVLAHLHVDDREGFLGRDLERGWQGEVRTTGTPSLCLAVSTAPAEGERTIGIVEDVSEAKRVVRALERAERARDLIAGSLAHDLRAPVFNIIMAADALAKHEQTPGDQAAVRRVLAGARRMTMKVEELVAFARLCIGDGLELSLAQIDLQTLTARCVERATQVGHFSSTTSQAPIPPLARPVERPTVVVTTVGSTIVTGDATMLNAALLTLIDNALRHGKPAVATVDINGSSDDEVVVAVKNDGMIRPDLIATMFELVRAPRSDVATSGGLGLGLFNARQIAFAHGGEIAVQSSVEGGTVFSLRLPRRVIVDGNGARPRASAALEQPWLTPGIPRASDEPTAPQPLQQRAPREFWLLLDRYTRLLEVSLHRRMFKNAGEALPDEVTRLADELGALHAGAREVADLHAQALRRASMMATAAKAQALVTEGRLLSLELMGRLLSYYRKRAGPPAAKGDAHDRTRQSRS